jgi:hypothetical protein
VHVAGSDCDDSEHEDGGRENIAYDKVYDFYHRVGSYGTDLSVLDA